MVVFVPNTLSGPCLYCGGGAPNAPEDLLRCELCHRVAHIRCLKCGPPKGQLLGDNLFSFTCASCLHTDNDTCVRAKLSTPQILLLVLYNLHQTDYSTRNGFYHWKVHIYKFINQHWKEIYGPESRKKKKKMLQTSLCGCLSHYGMYFMSGHETLREGGWYKLTQLLPPSQLIKQHTQDRLGTTEGKAMKAPQNEQGPSTGGPPQVKEEPAERDSLSSGEISFDSNSHDDSSRGSWFTERDLLKPNSCPPQALFDSEEEDEQTQDASKSIKTEIKDEETTQKESLNYIDVEGGTCKLEAEVSVSAPTQDVVCVKSLFTRNKSSVTPVTYNSHNPYKENSKANLRHLSSYEERQLLRQLDRLQENGPLPAHLHRLRRKLVVRKSKYEHGLPLFDLDAELRHLRTYGRLRSRREKICSKLWRETDDSTSRVLDRFQIGFGGQQQTEDTSTSFLIKLVGNPNEAYKLIHSPYTQRQLKPFIMRDYESVPLKVRLLQEIIKYPHQNDPSWQPPPRPPIDYCYVTPRHIPAMNQLARQFFWPGIDLSEVLQYPDHTCVVLYSRLVIGFGVLVPDTEYNMAYLSFLFVHPEWRRCGIATFMLYHLIQTCMGKDITLHVSATNPALILYQRFGFKVEEFLSDFYDKYLPEDSPECKHAMYLRLSR